MIELTCHKSDSTSPSAYIVFEYVYASDNCGIVGTPVNSVTVAVAPSDLSTSANTSQTAAAPINFADFNRCPQNVSYRVISGVTHDIAPASAGFIDACQPDIIFNGSIWDYATQESAWSTCTIAGVRAWDPPRTMSSVPGKSVLPRESTMVSLRSKKWQEVAE